jgi:hypothetical protein
VFLDREGDLLSSLPREEQVDLVAEVGIAALNYIVCGAVDAPAVPPDYVVQPVFPALDDEEEVDLKGWYSWLNF